jgi:predicted transcriptional regulator
MNYDPAGVRPSSTLHLPFTLLALAIAVFLGAQITSVNRSGKTMRWQLANLDQQAGNIQEAQKRLASLIQQREDLVKQSAQVQQQYTALFNEVLDLAKDDEDAKAVVQKWGIQKQAPASGSAEPASEAKTTP